MGQSISQQATHLLQRWQVTVYNLSYEYDQEGLHELQQRELKRKLEVLTEVKPVAKTRQDNQEVGRISKDDELIRKSANGVFIMYKSNFDFLEKPLGTVEDSSELRKEVKKQKTAKNSITQAFMAQKKSKCFAV